MFSATTRNDKLMYVFLAVTILLGLVTTVLTNLGGHGHDYRETVSPYFRSIFTFSPKPGLMGPAPLGFDLHVLSAWLLFGIWPFTRLVHVFSAPIGYVTRPYVPYRSRDTTARTGGSSGVDTRVETPSKAVGRRRPGTGACPSPAPPGRPRTRSNDQTVGEFMDDLMGTRSKAPSSRRA